MSADLLDTPSAAKRLGLKPATLNTWRSHNVGPSWVKVGRLVRYRAEDLEHYLDQGTRSTLPHQPRDPASMLLGAAA